MLVGVVGKPNVGKSTFFSAATLLPVAIENRPFTTIKPNIGIAYIRTPCVHPELGVADNPNNSLCIGGVRLIPIELVDCAGLISGSWQGKGLGNYFLDEIRKADALIHVVDAAGATDEGGQPCPPGTRDPLKDVEFLDLELSIWLNQIIQKDWRRITQMVEMKHSSLVDCLAERLAGLSIRRLHIAEAIEKEKLDPERPTVWSEDELLSFSRKLLKIAKPMLIAANKVDLAYAEANVKRLMDAGFKVIPCCAEAELVLRRAAEKKLINYVPGDSSFSYRDEANITLEQRRALTLIQERVLAKWGNTGVQEAINSAYFNLLEMITVYPVENPEHFCDRDGRVLPDVYLVPKGTTARQLAYMIHSDLGNSFLYAVDARTKMRLGEDYVLRDRSVISIVSTKGRRH
ncbi:MAG: redox-regulated ATPase YchF [Candidatus Bathyarchaeia archaeon]